MRAGGFLRSGLVVGIALTAAQTASAGSTCTVRQVDSGGIARCIAEVGAGGEVILLDGRHVVKPIAITHDLTIRAQNPGKAFIRNGRALELDTEEIFAKLRSNLPADPLFTVLGGTVVFEGIELEPPGVPVLSPRVVTGRAIEVVGGDVTLRDVVVRDHRAHNIILDDPYPPGGIALLAIGGTVTVDRGIYSNIDGGPLVGGAFYVTDGVPLRFTGPTVMEHNSSQKGGSIAVLDRAKLSLEGIADKAAVLRSNSAPYGGAVYVNSAEARIDDGRFENNAAVEGGAIRAANANLWILDGQFEDNVTATEVAQGGHIYSYYSDVDIDGGTFLRGISQAGGALVAHGSNVDVSGATFKDNAAAQGGAILLNSYETPLAASIHSSAFKGNDGESGAAISIYNIDLTVKNTEIAANGLKRGNWGGGLLCQQGALHLVGVTVKGNRAYSAAGGIGALSCPLVVDGGEWSSNVAEAVSSSGGALLAYESDVTLNGVDVLGNRGDLGGAIYIEGVNTLDIQGGTFAGNRAKWAGAMFTHVEVVNIDGTAFNDNRATSYGGALGLMAGVEEGEEWSDVKGLVSLTDVVFFDNRAPEGAAAMARSTVTQVIGSTFKDNQASDASALGGGLAQWGGTLDIGGTSFAGNSAQVGSAVTTVGLDDAWVHDSLFIGNTSLGGGVVFMDSTKSQTVSRNVFCGNLADDNAADLIITDVNGNLSGKGWAEVYNNLFDAEGNEAPSRVGLAHMDYEVHHNNFVHSSNLALAITASDGLLERNLFGWNSKLPVVRYFDGAKAGTIHENAWFPAPADGGQTWIAEGDTGVPLPPGHVTSDPLLRGEVGGTLPVDGCKLASHYPYPWSPLLLTGYQGDPRGDQIGMFGGETADDHHWHTDADGDGVALIFDCDDDDKSVLECKQKAEPEPEPTIVVWYGEGCSTTSGAGTWWAWLALPLLMVRRRTR